MARIGVPEADVSATDIGLSQIASIFGNEGLTTRNFDGRARPRLAESWTSSPDGLTWRFVLQKGIVFHDGSSATVPLIVESLRKGIASRAGQGFSPGLVDVEKVDAAGPLEVEIKLRRRSTFLLDDLDFPITRATQDKSVIGTGAFKTVSTSPSEIVMEPHDKYHQGRSTLDRVVIRAYATLRTAWASLMRNEIDVLWDVSTDAAEFVRSSDVALYSYLRQYQYLVGFNNRRAKFTTPVRRALNAAVDREALIQKTLQGQGVAASSPLWPEHWAYDASVSNYVFDPRAATAILDAAGLKPVQRRDGRRSRFSFVCILPEKWTMWERIALEVQKQLYEIGVDMQLEMLPADEYNRRLMSGNFDAVMIELISGPTYSRPYTFWRWGGDKAKDNMFGYRSATADRWFDVIRSAANDAEYRAAAGQLQRVLLEDPPALFLAWSQRTRAISRRFSVEAEPGRDPVTTFWRWQVNGAAAATR